MEAYRPIRARISGPGMTMNELRGRGRPRSSGTHRCDRCKNWLPGFASTGRTGLSAARASLPRSTRQVPARIAMNLGSCPAARRSGKRSAVTAPASRQTSPAANAVARQNAAEAAIAPPASSPKTSPASSSPMNRPDLRLHRLIRELASTDRPRSIISWMRLPEAQALLNSIGARTLELSHEAFDALPPAHAVEHLREMLVHHHILPGRGDIRLFRFEAGWTRDWAASKTVRGSTSPWKFSVGGTTCVGLEHATADKHGLRHACRQAGNHRGRQIHGLARYRTRPTHRQDSPGTH